MHPGFGSPLREHTAHGGKPFFGDHISQTRRRAAIARVIHEVFEVVSIVVGQFLAAKNRSPRNNPDPVSIVQLGITVRFAAVIDQARGVPADFPVHIVLLIQRKDVGVLLQAQFVRIVFGNSSPTILDQPGSGGDVAASEEASPMDARPPNLDRLQRLTHLHNIGFGSLKVRSPATYGPAHCLSFF